MKPKDPNKQPASVTQWLAYSITGTVLVATFLIAMYSLYQGNNDTILQTLLPLWGTWIGTVLAFYFGKSNFEVATQALAKHLNPHEKMSSLQVKDYMIPFNELQCLTYDESEKEDKDKEIYEILKYKRFEPFNRFAVLDKNGVAKYVIHRNLFGMFISTQVEKEGADIDKIKELTLKDLVECSDDKIKTLLKNSVAVVPINATLLDAKNKIDSIPECVDVFITETGAAGEKVKGLITNNLILKAVTV